MQNVTILGSTGTIGEQTLDVMARHPSQYKVFALTANTNVNAMLKQCLQYKPSFAVMLDKEAAKLLQDALGKENNTMKKT